MGARLLRMTLSGKKTVICGLCGHTKLSEGPNTVPCLAKRSRIGPHGERVPVERCTGHIDPKERP